MDMGPHESQDGEGSSSMAMDIDVDEHAGTSQQEPSRDDITACMRFDRDQLDSMDLLVSQVEAQLGRGLKPSTAILSLLQQAETNEDRTLSLYVDVDMCFDPIRNHEPTYEEKAAFNTKCQNSFCKPLERLREERIQLNKDLSDLLDKAKQGKKKN